VFPVNKVSLGKLVNLDKLENPDHKDLKVSVERKDRSVKLVNQGLKETPVCKELRVIKVLPENLVNKETRVRMVKLDLPETKDKKVLLVFPENGVQEVMLVKLVDEDLVDDLDLWDPMDQMDLPDQVVPLETLDPKDLLVCEDLLEPNLLMEKSVKSV